MGRLPHFLTHGAPLRALRARAPLILSIEKLVLVVVLVSGKVSSISELENMQRIFNKEFTFGLINIQYKM